jgi:hypothetical protein
VMSKLLICCASGREGVVLLAETQLLMENMIVALKSLMEDN